MQCHIKQTDIDVSATLIRARQQGRNTPQCRDHARHKVDH